MEKHLKDEHIETPANYHELKVLYLHTFQLYIYSCVCVCACAHSQMQMLMQMWKTKAKSMIRNFYFLITLTSVLYKLHGLESWFLWLLISRFSTLFNCFFHFFLLSSYSMKTWGDYMWVFLTERVLLLLLSKSLWKIPTRQNTQLV